MNFDLDYFGDESNWSENQKTQSCPFLCLRSEDYGRLHPISQEHFAQKERSAAYQYIEPRVIHSYRLPMSFVVTLRLRLGIRNGEGLLVR